MAFELDCLNRNIVFCNSVEDAALYLRSDIANLCGEIAKKMSPCIGLNSTLQIHLMQALSKNLSEMAETYEKNLYFASLVDAKEDANGEQSEA